MELFGLGGVYQRIMPYAPQDLRQAFRVFRTNPSWTVLAVVTLALGISVSNTAFILVNAICIRGLPIDRPDRVVFIRTIDAQAAPGGMSYPDFLDVHRSARSFEGLAAYTGGPLVVSDADQAAERANAAFVSAYAFRLLGERPVMGRDFQPADDANGAAPVVLLGSAMWRSRYGSTPDIIGRVVRINGAPATVVGVMAEGFRFPGNAHLWQPLAAAPGLRDERRDNRALSVFGRLTPGSSLPAAQRELDAIAAGLASDYPATNRSVKIQGRPINEHFNGDITSPVWLAFLTAGNLVLLVACANVANLLLMRAASRRREMAIRAAMGATRLRLLRQLLIESFALAGVSGFLGLGLSFAAARWLASTVPAALPLPYWIQFTLDGRVLLFVLFAAFASVVISGLAPALQFSRARAREALNVRDASSGTVHTRRWTSAFLAVEFALSLVLLSHIGLAVRQSWIAERTEMPIDTASLMTARLTLPAQTYSSPEERSRFYKELTDRLSMLDQVSAVTVTTHAPFGGAVERALAIEARPAPAGEPRPIVQTVAVGPEYFRTLGFVARRGRLLDLLDGTLGHEAVVVNERFAALHFAGQEAVGRRIQLTRVGSPDSEQPWVTIVGVVPTVRQRGTTTPDPVVYTPLRIEPPSSAVLVVRSAVSPEAAIPAVREIVRQIDPNLPLDRAMPMSQALRESGWNARMSATIISTLSAIALGMGLVGLYAVTTYAVAQRRREIGIRMALGAQPRDVGWMVLRRVLLQLAAGVALGFVCTLAFDAAFGDSSNRATDAVIFLPLSGLVIVVAIAACAWPALRAARLDPASTVNCE